MKTILSMLATALLALPLAQAQGFPTKPIRLVVTYPAGGGADLMAVANMASGLPHVKSGKPRALAITGEKRSPALP